MIKIDHEKNQIWLMLNLKNNYTLEDIKKELSKLNGVDNFKLIIKQGVWDK